MERHQHEETVLFESALRYMKINADPIFKQTLIGIVASQALKGAFLKDYMMKLLKKYTTTTAEAVV